MVAAGFGISMVPHSISQIRAEGVAYMPIEGESLKAPIALAYNRDNRSPLVRNFVALAIAVVRKGQARHMSKV